MKINSNIIKSVIIGHAVGDALGVPVEFKGREELKKQPITDMTEYGTHNQPKGAWSDDTSMSICALDSLRKNKFDLDEIMQNFGIWLMDGGYTATGECFDVGIACKNSIIDYHAHRLSTEECGQESEFSNGNGSLMRIHPFVLYVLFRDGEINESNTELIFAASAITHAHMRSKLACGIYSYILWKIIKNPQKSSIISGIKAAAKAFEHNEEKEHFARIFDEDLGKLTEDQIESDGYVVHTLEAALWSLLTTDSYEECVLRAVNLGEDTDTVAAIAGSLAGALYGYDNIPCEWRDSLMKREYIESMCEFEG